jgi:hypothetical protein
MTFVMLFKIILNKPLKNELFNLHLPHSSLIYN